MSQQMILNTQKYLMEVSTRIHPSISVNILIINYFSSGEIIICTTNIQSLKIFIHSQIVWWEGHSGCIFDLKLIHFVIDALFVLVFFLSVQGSSGTCCQILEVLFILKYPCLIVMKILSTDQYPVILPF